MPQCKYHCTSGYAAGDTVYLKYDSGSPKAGESGALGYTTLYTILRESQPTVPVILEKKNKTKQTTKQKLKINKNNKKQ